MSENSQTIVVVLGIVAGIVFGVVVTLASALDALVVLGTGMVGGGVAWVVHGILSGRLDFGAAWRALFRR